MVYGVETISAFHLSKKSVTNYFYAGKTDSNQIRWFADDDYGLHRFLADIQNSTFSVSSPYELLPQGCDFLFVGIGDGLKKCRIEEILPFVKQGNCVVLLPSSDRYSYYIEKLSKEISVENIRNLADNRVFQITIDNGSIFLIQDQFAFCNARFSENQPLWEYIKKNEKV